MRSASVAALQSRERRAPATLLDSRRDAVALQAPAPGRERRREAARSLASPLPAAAQPAAARTPRAAPLSRGAHSRAGRPDARDVPAGRCPPGRPARTGGRDRLARGPRPRSRQAPRRTDEPKPRTRPLQPLRHAAPLRRPLLSFVRAGAPGPFAGVTECPRCGARDAGGEYCLTCGSLLRLPTRSDRFRERAAGNHLWTALAVLVLAALGALVAIAASRGGSTEQTVVATSLPDRTTVRAAPVLGTLAEQPTTAPATTAAPRPPAGPTSTTLTEWTLADGYTLVLASVPKDSGRATAVQIAKRALSQGLPSVGILASEDFAGLHPGYFVVFSGVYSSNPEAMQHVSEATAAGFSAAYARLVTR